MFGLSTELRTAAPTPAQEPGQPEWSEAVRLAGERDTLGLFLTGHPIGRFEADLPHLVSARIGDLVSERPVPGGEGTRGFFMGKPATVAGLVYEIRKRGTRTSFVLDDRSGRIEVTLFEEVYQQYREVIGKDALVLVEGTVRFDEFIDGWRLAAKRITELHRLREQRARGLIVTLPANAPPAFAARLAETLEPWRAGASCDVFVRHANRAAYGRLAFGPEWRVRPTRELVERLETLTGNRVIPSYAAAADSDRLADGSGRP
jgi:DNA polymerase III subunit alpha